MNVFSYFRKYSAKFGFISMPFVFVALIALVAYDFIYITDWFNRDTPVTTSDLGTFGDFLGGLLNPIIAFLALVWLRESVRLQKEELSGAKEILSNQQFDTTFFNLLNNIEVSLSRLRDYQGGEHINVGIKWVLYRSIDADCLATSLEIISSNNNIIGDYHRKIYWILKYIAIKKGGASADINNDFFSLPVSEDEKFYSAIVRSSIGDFEARLLMLNCLQEDGKANFDKFKKLVERYAFLEHMTLFDGTTELSILTQAAKHYENNAFGNNQSYHYAVDNGLI